MTSVALPPDLPPGPAAELRLRALLRRFVREPAGVVYANGLDRPPTAVVFDPDLTPTEAQRVNLCLALLACPFDWTPDDLAVFRAEQATLASYLAKNQPTQAETAAALKALIRVVRAIIRTS